MLNTYWKRYVFFQCIRKIILFTISFFLIYVLIDYAIYAKQFSSSNEVSFFDIFIYYLCLFAKRLHFTLLIALTLSIVSTIIGMNEKRELVALFCSGLSKKTFSLFFFYLSFFCATLILLNFQLGIPASLSFLENFEHQYLKKSKKLGFKKVATYALTTKEGYKVLFSKKDPFSSELYDVFLLFSVDDLWKIAKLDPLESSAIGYGADHFTRNGSGALELVEHQDIKKFPSLHIDFLIKKKGQTSYEDLSLLHLLTSCIKNRSFVGKEPVKMLTQCIYKITLPFLSFLIIIVCVPFCLVFSRRLPIFMIYAMSILGVMTFLTILDAGVILAEGQALSAWVALLCPFFGAVGLFGPKFLRSCKN